MGQTDRRTDGWIAALTSVLHGWKTGSIIMRNLLSAMSRLIVKLVWLVPEGRAVALSGAANTESLRSLHRVDYGDE